MGGDPLPADFGKAYPGLALSADLLLAAYLELEIHRCEVAAQGEYLQPDALLLAQVISDVVRAYPELRGHLIFQHLQHNAAVHTLPSLGPVEKHIGIKSPWPNLYCAGDWVRDSLPSFFLERACGTGIKAPNLVLQSRGLGPWSLLEYLPPEPFAAWIENRMRSGRDRLRKKRKG